RGEFMAKRNAGEGEVDVLARRGEREGGHALADHIAAPYGDPVRLLADLFEKLQQVARLRILTRIGDDFDRAHQTFEIALELGFQVCVEHGCTPWNLGGIWGRGSEPAFP